MTSDLTAFTGRQLRNLQVSLTAANDQSVRYKPVEVCILPADGIRLLGRVDDARRAFDSTGNFTFPPVRVSRRILSFVDPVRHVYSVAAPDGVRFLFATISSGGDLLATEPLTPSAILGGLLRQAKSPAFRELFNRLVEEDRELAGEVLIDHDKYPSVFAIESGPLPLDRGDLTKLLAADDPQVKNIALKTASTLRRAS